MFFLGSNLVKLELRCPTIIRDRVYNEVRCGINLSLIHI